MSKFARKTSGIILSLFLCLNLFVYLRADSRRCVWKDVERIVAVGDIHGDCDNFVKIIKSAGLVDERLKWTGGKTHFVQTGDILDRGDCPKEVLDIMMRLQKEAEEAGGKVHFLLGNHEEMNITGIVFRQAEYVSPKQFASFLPDNFRKKKEDKFRAQLQNLSEIETNSDTSFLDSYLSTKWKETMKDTELQKLYVNTFNKDYGRWIIEQNCVIKINDIIFSHGGVSEKYADWPLQKINDTIRNELNTYRIAIKRGLTPRMKREILYMPDSPLWNRDFALKDEKTYQKVVDRILKNLDAKYMVIAHTPPGSAIIPENEQDEIVFRTRFNQKVWMIDTGISDFYYGIMSYFYVENGIPKMKEWRDEEEYEEAAPFETTQIIPGDESREDVEYYLMNAAVVDVYKDAVPGRTAAWRIDLDDGETKRKAMFKTVDDTRPTGLPDSFKYELAAYALDKLLDFQKIPPAVERKIDDTWGSLQIMIEKCFDLDEQQRNDITPADPQAFANTLEEINVFENLVYKERDELDDILIQEETWKIFRVDFSEAFSPSQDLIPEQNITRCSKKLFQNLQNLSDEVIQARLDPYLNDKELSTLLSRKALIIKTIKKRIEEKGEEAVLF
jgi:hypothetical protein